MVGNQADSREHRHKASDLRREFAPEEYGANDVVTSRRGDGNTSVRGPNAKAVKYRANLCQACNNQRSQPFDNAYDQLIEGFLASESEIERTGRIALDQIYDDHMVGSNAALGYFVKHIGCRIADYGFEVPQTFCHFLDGRGEPAGLAMSFEINRQLAAIHAIMRRNPEKGTGFLGWGPLTGTVSRDRAHADQLRGWWSYHGLQMIWEWQTDYTHSWTNLLGPVARLPLTHGKEGRALLRLASPGRRGAFWKRWYQAQQALGLAPYGKDAASETDDFVDLSEESNAKNQPG